MTTDFMVINFDPTGTVSAMHRDQFQLGFLGKQEIKRASEIKFNSDTQKWDVYLPHGDGGSWEAAPYAQGFAEYNDARSFEVEWLEQCALAGVTPMGNLGYQIGAAARIKMNNRVRIA